MDWIAAIMIALSAYMTGRKNKWGWVASIIGCIIFIWIAISNKIYGMAGLNTFVMILSIINFIKWHKDELRSKV